MLAGFDQQTNVFVPQDSAQIPDYVAPSSVGTAWAPDLLFLNLHSLDHTYGGNINVDITTTIPAGCAIEVRSTDDSWGCNNSPQQPDRPVHVGSLPCS